MNISSSKLHCIIIESIKSLLNERIEGRTPDYFEYDGSTYEAMVDGSIALIYHNGEWLHNGETHRDMICLCKYGVEEWELDEYYNYDKCRMIRANLDRLWSDGSGEFKYPSRIFYAKGSILDKGIKYILISWDDLDESLIDSICSQLKINRDELIYLDNDF